MVDFLAAFILALITLVGARRVRWTWKQLQERSVPMSDRRVEKVKFSMN